MSRKDEQEDITKVRNNTELFRKLKVLENDSSSRKKETIIANKYSDVVWNNDEARMNMISVVKKNNGFQKEGS